MLLLLAVLFVALALFGVKFATRYASRVGGKTVTARFEAAEALLKRGEIPTSWLRRRRAEAEDSEQIKATLIERLDELNRFFASCPFFKDGDARTLMLNQLRQIGEQWRARSPQEWQSRARSPAHDAP